MPERPERMYRRDRQVVNYFEDDEVLFSRFLPEHWIEGKLSPAAIHFPRTSVNRSSMSLADDVLWRDDEDERYDWCGVFQFTVGRLRKMRLSTGVETVQRFRPEHQPLPKNYSHTELVCHVLSLEEEVKPTSAVRKKFRAELSQFIEIIIPAPT